GKGPAIIDVNRAEVGDAGGGGVEDGPQGGVAGVPVDETGDIDLDDFDLLCLASVVKGRVGREPGAVVIRAYEVGRAAGRAALNGDGGVADHDQQVGFVVIALLADARGSEFTGGGQF